MGVANIDYNAKGQRTLIEYGNGASTYYRYDQETFRLIQLLAVRGKIDAAECAPILNPRTCEDPPTTCSKLNSNRCILQNLNYTFDPAGNITHIQDKAQQIIYFKNIIVEPSNDYTYDALYRLIQATGREHLGQPLKPIPYCHDDACRTTQHPNDGKAMGRYTERYVYDAVGNFLKMQHYDSANAGWMRSYYYTETSLIEDGSGGAPLKKTSNRLTGTKLHPNSSSPKIEPYTHDGHGNMTSMKHMATMIWDFKDQLQKVDLSVVGGTAYYVYDADGNRVCKVWVKSPGLTEERIYLGGFEIFRKHGGPIGPNTATLERETLHVMDDKQRIAIVETRALDTQGNDQAPAQLIRYQFGNHLGSASLELDDQAQIISYEEYAPYGSTTYQAVRSQTEMPKRYRFTGKERDEESGLYYHDLRYYSNWLCRWISCDPIDAFGGFNLYEYCFGNPIIHVDRKGSQPKNEMLILGHWDVPGKSWVERVDETKALAREQVPICKPKTFMELSTTEEAYSDVVEKELFDKSANMPGGFYDKKEWAERQKLGTASRSFNPRRLARFKGAASSILVQEAMENKTPVFIDARGIDLAKKGNWGSEMRTMIATAEAECKAPVDYYIYTENGLSVIRKGSSSITGAPLPENLTSASRTIFRSVPHEAGPAVMGSMSQEISPSSSSLMTSFRSTTRTVGSALSKLGKAAGIAGMAYGAVHPRETITGGSVTIIEWSLQCAYFNQCDFGMQQPPSSRDVGYSPESTSLNRPLLQYQDFEGLTTGPQCRPPKYPWGTR